MIRGGSYLCHHSYCLRYRVSARNALHARPTTGNVGFRAVAAGDGVGSALLHAFGIGLFAQLSLLLAGLLVCWVTVRPKIVGILGGFGAGR